MTSLPGFEPGTFGLEVQRAIHCATGTVIYNEHNFLIFIRYVLDSPITLICSELFVAPLFFECMQIGVTPNALYQMSFDLNWSKMSSHHHCVLATMYCWICSWQNSSGNLVEAKSDKIRFLSNNPMLLTYFKIISNIF